MSALNPNHPVTRVMDGNWHMNVRITVDAPKEAGHG